MPEKTVPEPKDAQTKLLHHEDTRTQERFIPPMVDIYETEQGLAVVADLPGVKKEDMDIKVADGILTIQGKTSHVTQGTPLYREFEMVSFYRQFQLSEEIDQVKINASLRHGVLHLGLPKAEKAKPKQVKVQVH